MNHSKGYKQAAEKRDADQHYSPEEAIRLIKEMATAKFDESIDVAMRLGVDPRKADQMVRGTVNLPHGTGKTSPPVTARRLPWLPAPMRWAAMN